MRKFQIILFTFILVSCKKDNLEINFMAKDIINYGGDSLYIGFNINVKGGKPPYTYHWITPDSLSGEGQFSLYTKQDLRLELRVSDNSGKSKLYEYELLIDQYKNQIEFDYRYKLTGDFMFSTYSGVHADPIIYAGTINLFENNRLHIIYEDGDPLTKTCVYSLYTETSLYRTQINPIVTNELAFTTKCGPDILSGGFVCPDTLKFVAGMYNHWGNDMDTVIGIRIPE